MPINYNVQAEVIDLRFDTPQDDDMFLVDTKVWYWLTYTQASTYAVPYQYDLMILEAMDKAGINQVITDDGDYVTVPRIKVFTANQNAIAAARSQGKLITR
jgi:hypothetical protein